MDQQARWNASRSRPRGPDRVDRAARLVLAARRILLIDADWLRLLSAAGLFSIGVLLLVGAGLTDRYFHRGVNTGAEEPYVFLPTGRDLATNVDLRIFQSIELPTVATVLQSSGFRIVRQPLLWSDVEPTQGDFAWERYDAIVAELNARDIEIVAVIQGTPAWARTAGEEGATDASPLDQEVFAGFVRQVVERYGAEIAFVQIWDRPNEPDRWGGRVATPAEYATLLATAHGAIQSARPSVLTVLAEFEPNPANDGLDDLSFLAGLYSAGAAPFFDVVAATVDGGGRSPYDRRIEPERANLSRVVLMREAMERAGDAATPIWGTRFGWEVSEPPRGVSADDQATFVLDALDRARTEWPWLGLLFAWSLYPSAGDPDAGYALWTIGNDGRPRATQLFHELGTIGTGAGSVAGVGFVPTNARAIGYSGRWQDQSLPPRAFRTTNEVGATIRVAFDGTGLIAYLRLSENAGTIDALLDGKPLPAWTESSLASSQADDVPVLMVSGLPEGPHELVLTLREGGDLTVGGFIVVRDLPFLWPVALLAGAGCAMVVLAVWLAIGVVAIRNGVLRRRRGEDVWLNVPELPRVPAVRRI
jgi:polysaccharide biosynthesis protein PslG